MVDQKINVKAAWKAIIGLEIRLITVDIITTTYLSCSPSDVNMYSQHNNIILLIYIIPLVMQDTWEKRLAYLQVTVELIAMSSEKQSTHNQSYAQPVSHLFETAVDIAVQGNMHIRERGRERDNKKCFWLFTIRHGKLGGNTNFVGRGAIQYKLHVAEHTYPWWLLKHA